MIIASLLNGGEDFAGKSGRKTATACETSAMDTSVIAAAHFMSRGLIKFQTRVTRKIFARLPVIKCKRARLVIGQRRSITTSDGWF
jgi:hypothetical protein